MLKAGSGAAGFDINHELLFQQATEYLQQPEIHTDYFDWLLVDVMVFEELDAYGFHYLATKGSTALLNLPALFANGHPTRYLLWRLAFGTASFGLWVILPMYIAFRSSSGGHTYIAACIALFWGINLAWMILGFPFRRSRRLKSFGLLVHMLGIYSMLGGTTISPRRLRDKINAAARDGVVYRDELFSIIDRILQRDPTSFIPERVLWPEPRTSKDQELSRPEPPSNKKTAELSPFEEYPDSPRERAEQAPEPSASLVWLNSLEKVIAQVNVSNQPLAVLVAYADWRDSLENLFSDEALPAFDDVSAEWLSLVRKHVPLGAKIGGPSAIGISLPGADRPAALALAERLCAIGVEGLNRPCRPAVFIGIGVTVVEPGPLPNWLHVWRAVDRASGPLLDRKNGVYFVEPADFQRN
jgi:hypothetical protein